MKIVFWKSSARRAWWLATGRVVMVHPKRSSELRSAVSDGSGNRIRRAEDFNSTTRVIREGAVDRRMGGRAAVKSACRAMIETADYKPCLGTALGWSSRPPNETVGRTPDDSPPGALGGRAPRSSRSHVTQSGDRSGRAGGTKSPGSVRASLASKRSRPPSADEDGQPASAARDRGGPPGPTPARRASDSRRQDRTALTSAGGAPSPYLKAGALAATNLGKG